MRKACEFHTRSISFCKRLCAETGLCAIADFERFKIFPRTNAHDYTQFMRSLYVVWTWKVRDMCVFCQCSVSACASEIWLLARTSLTNHLQNTHMSLTKHAQSTYAPLTITYKRRINCTGLGLVRSCAWNVRFL